MDKDQLIKSLKRQLLVERSVIAVVILFLVLRWAYTGIAKTPYAILVDNRPVALLDTRASAEKVLADVKRSKAGTVNKVEFIQDVKIARHRSDDPLSSEDKAVKQAKKTLRLKMEKWLITANGKPVVAVDSKEMAGYLLETFKAKYGGQVDNLLEEPQFKENVKVELTNVDEALYRRTEKEALVEMMHPVSKHESSQVAEYAVRQGDIAANIASRHGLSLEKLEALNPGRNIARLQIGDKLRISGGTVTVSKPKITVIVRDVTSEVQPIPYTTQSTSSTNMFEGKQLQTQAGRNGLRKVKLAVTFENGVRTGSEIVEEEIIREAVPRRVVMGIKRRG